MSTSKGRIAESVVRDWLISRGHRLVAQNWRTRYCEIDLITFKQKMLYFVEVKYRQNNRQGSGLEYIDAKKQQRLEFAARMFMAKHGLICAYQIVAVEVDGKDFTVSRAVTLTKD